MRPFAPALVPTQGNWWSRILRQITPGKPVAIPEGNLSTKNRLKEAVAGVSNRRLAQVRCLCSLNSGGVRCETVAGVNCV